MKLGVVGLGKMGQAVAERLLYAGEERLLGPGNEVAVFNRTPGREGALVERGARVGESLGELDVIFSSLADDEALEGWAPRFAELRPGAVLVEMSTVSVAASRRLAEQLDEAGVRYLRSPASGNPGAVRAGTAALVVSGDRADYDEVEPLLKAITPTVRYVGQGEAARVVKLAFQILIVGTAELLGEALVLGEAAGVEREALLEAIGASVVGSTFVKYKSEPLLRDDYTATFTSALMQKDVELIFDLADEAGVELPATREIASVLDATARNGHADEDFMAMLLELKDRAGSATTHRER
jgi:3-hydroxyisobutyrate dehydrogenase-like beta-hydroxyacid dehydrogenase